MNSLDAIRQSVLDHEAPTSAELSRRLSRQQRRNAVIVLVAFIGVFLGREALAGSGEYQLVTWVLTALLWVWAVALVAGMVLQPFVKARYERRMLAYVGAEELEEAARVVERLPGIAPVVDRWNRKAGGLRRLEFEVLHAAAEALERIDAAGTRLKAERAARAKLDRTIEDHEKGPPSR